MPEIILAADNLTIGYHNTRPILRDVNFTARRGEMIGLIGANGAGKSTLLKTLRGLIAPLAGTVEIFGRPAAAIDEREFALRAAYLQQGVDVPFGYTAREIVLISRYPRLNWWQNEDAGDEAIVDAAMAYTGVSELAARPFHQLSGGQRQRVLLAKVLAQQTPLLFLDEPATGLDIFYQEEIFRFCHELCAVGKTVLMVVHEMSLAARFCSRLLLAGAGKILADGPADAVLTPEKLSAAYGAAVNVVKNPLTGTVEITTVPPAADRQNALLQTITGGEVVP